MALLNPRYLDAVVAIGTKKDTVWYGTGFFYGHFIKRGDKAGHVLFLVTNRHILESQIKDGNTEILLKCNSKDDGTAREMTLSLYDETGDEYSFLYHPNPNIDLAILPVDYNKIKKEMKVDYIRENQSLTINKMKDEGVSEGDFVFILGFPMGNVGTSRKCTIVRSGIIARISDAFHGDSEDFLLDAFIFPGNSGGPVITKPELTGMVGTKQLDKSVLIGVVKEYLSYEEIAKSEQTGQTKVIFTENSGLALVHPINFVNEIIRMYMKNYPY